MRKRLTVVALVLGIVASLGMGGWYGEFVRDKAGVPADDEVWVAKFEAFASRDARPAAQFTMQALQELDAATGKKHKDAVAARISDLMDEWAQKHFGRAVKGEYDNAVFEALLSRGYVQDGTPEDMLPAAVSGGAVPLQPER